MRLISVGILKTYESCERTTFYVELTNVRGQTITPTSYATGSVYTDHKGLSIEEARDRALIDATEWADFFGVPMKPYVENGVGYEPSMILGQYRRRAVS